MPAPQNMMHHTALMPLQQTVVEPFFNHYLQHLPALAIGKGKGLRQGRLALKRQFFAL